MKTGPHESGSVKPTLRLRRLHEKCRPMGVGDEGTGKVLDCFTVSESTATRLDKVEVVEVWLQTTHTIL